MPFALGQRWISDSETDLGLGTVVALEGRMVTLLFPASGENRLYARADAPLTRVMFNVGDTISSHEDWQLSVEEVKEKDGLLTYIGTRVDDSSGPVELKETFLNHYIKFNKPQDRLFAGQIDRMDRFVMRYRALNYQYQQQRSPLRGLQGPRLSLIPHQLHIGYEVGHRYAPRVLLADEVGLGKTIEAGLIIHQQLLNGRARRVLLLVPETLQHQWLVEMMRRFNLYFSIFDEERCVEAYADADNPFDTEQLVLCSLDFLRKKKRRFEQVLDTEWDLLVVDEAHHLKWSEQTPSREYQLVEALAEQVPGVLLLTATPDQLGHESHFARLRLLDPDRFYDYDAFVAEEQNYHTIAAALQPLLDDDLLSEEAQKHLSELLPEVNIEPELRLVNDSDEDLHTRRQARQTLINQLLDRHGTSRVLFRNTRAGVQGFPERRLCSYPLPMPTQYKTAIKVGKMMAGSRPVEQQASQMLFPEEIFQQFEGKDASWAAFDPRVDWLLTLLQERRRDKILVICAHADTALVLEEALRTREGIRATVFHEQMSIIERDKAGAYFAQQEGGAQVLLCSEIGSEGRNFQFAHHLVLFDLPCNPDLLEQRIGRLDRIGQTETVHIHVPYLEGSSQALLHQWYHHGLDAFEHTCPTGNIVYEQVQEPLLTLLSQDAPEATAVQELVDASRQLHLEIRHKLEQGRDRLLELNSRGSDPAQQLIAQLAEQDQQTELPLFALRLFDILGINQDDKGENAVVLTPSEHMLVPHVPGLPQDGCTITFDRATALSRDDMQYLTWEHPLLQGSMELILTSEIGTTSVSLLKNKALPAGTTFLELLFVAETSAPVESQIGRFLPPTPIRMLMDKNGNDLAAKISFDHLNNQLTPVNRHLGSKLVNASQTMIHSLLQRAQEQAETQKQALVAQATTEMEQTLSGEYDRLRALQTVNPNIRDEELDHLQQVREQLAGHLAQAQLKLDAIRFIIVTHN